MTAVAEQSGQSRVGKRPVPVPDGVVVKIDGVTVNVKGPKGELQRTMPDEVTMKLVDKHVIVGLSKTAGRKGKQFQGLARALLSGMVEGTSKGFNVSLDLVGVGYRCEIKGQDLHMALGLSHPVDYTMPDVVSAKVETVDEGGLKKPRLHLSSCDKEVLGRTAARIKSFRPPEPYKGKGVRFTGERVREKAGKAGGKK